MNDKDHDVTNLEIEENSILHLQLFVAGTSSLSVRAINNLNVILAENLEGQYELDIIDVYQQPQIALQEDITAVPMLVKKFPSPNRKLIGDMSNKAKVLRGLGIK
ncbi:circadian clock KaiB family protein [Pedobacter sp. MC2016-15]|uniref:circadian clock KaiB family protein n=1 Tax=Pedobacter sp. MC2016-15 TaxID=2994473 RepID=UPI0022452D85|nr:circadian clock KaiB family protein [Pedobacter sp. MC2016-15]MCX2480598.1 circadian clock KaiB family protein [Pedobacter sp. MC2016-15]